MATDELFMRKRKEMELEVEFVLAEYHVYCLAWLSNTVLASSW